MKYPSKDNAVACVKVAPARERGLKLDFFNLHACTEGRSREGAWIEMTAGTTTGAMISGRSREGAWIEIRICLGIGIVVMSLPRGSVD